MIVKYDEYIHDRELFFKTKHKSDFRLENTGSSAEYYRKTYSFEDGAVWYEVSRKIYEEKEIEVYLCSTRVTVELLETEYWNSDNADSKKYYENWKVHTN